MKKNIFLIIFVVVIVALVVFLIDSNQMMALRGDNSLARGDFTLIRVSNGDNALSKALDYYYEKTGDEMSDGIKAEKINFGCHSEIYVYKNGQVEMRLSYTFGRIYELK